MPIDARDGLSFTLSGAGDNKDLFCIEDRENSNPIDQSILQTIQGNKKENFGESKNN